jgi:hypothetical protein
MLDAALRRRIIQLREQGKAIAEISEIVGKNKSTIHYIVRNVILNAAARASLKSTQLSYRLVRLAHITPEQRRANGIKGGKACQRMHGQRVVKNLTEGNGSLVSGLTYRADEKSYLVKLERLFGTKFAKQAAGRFFLDFANDSVVIEVTSDPTQGIRDAISRFEYLHSANDVRKRIVYLPFKRRNTKRLGELGSLGVEVRHIAELSNASP